MKRRAILVGPQQYHMLGDLKYTRNDARATSEVFQKYCGFEPGSITLMTCNAGGGLNAQSTYVEQALENLRLEQLEADDPLDLLVFGFWGHGFAPIPGQRYLCGVETMENKLSSTAISLELVEAKLKQIPAKNTLLLLDCCQNQPDGRSTGAEPMSQGEGTAQDSMARDIQAAHANKLPSLEPTVAVLSACSEGEKAYEWDDREHGIFTAHFLDSLRSGKSGIAELAQFTRQQVSRTARDLFHQPQNPRLKLEGGDIRLVTIKPPIADIEHGNSKSAAFSKDPSETFKTVNERNKNHQSPDHRQVSHSEDPKDRHSAAASWKIEFRKAVSQARDLLEGFRSISEMGAVDSALAARTKNLIVRAVADQLNKNGILDCTQKKEHELATFGKRPISC